MKRIKHILRQVKLRASTVYASLIAKRKSWLLLAIVSMLVSGLPIKQDIHTTRDVFDQSYWTVL